MNKLWIIVSFFFLVHHSWAQTKTKHSGNDRTTNNVTRLDKKRAHSLIHKYNEEGRLIEYGYKKNGFKDKTWVSYDEYGNIWVVGNFEKGIRSGTWLVFDPNGKVKYEIEYEKNRVIKALDWHERHMAGSQQ